MSHPLRQFLINHPRLIRHATRMIPDIEWTVPCRPVGKMRVRLRLNKGLWFHDPLKSERHQLAIIKSWITPGDTVYDIGANIGYVLRFMGNNCGAGKLFAFEPVPFNRALLEKNITLGGLGPKTRVFPCAVGDKDGRIEFTLDEFTGATGCIDSVHSEGMSWAERWGVKETHKITVPLLTIDGLVERGEATVPRLIKIDVEGAEEFVVQGARQLLTAHHPRLVIELHSLEHARATMRLLHEMGYALFGQSNLLEHRPALRRFSASEIEAAKERDDLPFHLYATPDAAELEREIIPYGE